MGDATLVCWLINNIYYSYFYTLHIVKSLFNASQEKAKIIYFTDKLAECQSTWRFHIQSISVPKDADGYAVRFLEAVIFEFSSLFSFSIA